MDIYLYKTLRMGIEQSLIKNIDAVCEIVLDKFMSIKFLFYQQRKLQKLLF